MWTCGEHHCHPPAKIKKVGIDSEVTEVTWGPVSSLNGYCSVTSPCKEVSMSFVTNAYLNLMKPISMPVAAKPRNGKQASEGSRGLSAVSLKKSRSPSSLLLEKGVEKGGGGSG